MAWQHIDIHLRIFGLFLAFLVIGCHAQWVFDDDGCRTPDRGSGSCVLINNCKTINDVLEKAPQPLSSGIIKLLQSYHCGFQGRSPKVCCPKKPIVIDLGPSPKPSPSDALPDVSNHRNLKLLTNKCGQFSLNNKIVNGNKTFLGEFPWMALLSYATDTGNEFRCGGTIINERYILTAAHCIKNSRYPLVGVRVGEYDLRTDRDCGINYDGEDTCASPVQDLAIEETIPHPRYNTTTLYGDDIALLRVGKIDFTKENAKPVCLPLENRNQNFTNKFIIVTGWGATESARQSPVLLKAQLPTTPFEDCRKTYAQVAPISPKQMCAGGRNRTDTCSGDSGGPLHFVGRQHDDTRYIQHGVVSFGPRFCGLEGFPGVYTRVAYYMDWILDNMKP